MDTSDRKAVILTATTISYFITLKTEGDIGFLSTHKRFCKLFSSPVTVDELLSHKFICVLTNELDMGNLTGNGLQTKETDVYSSETP